MFVHATTAVLVYVFGRWKPTKVKRQVVFKLLITFRLSLYEVSRNGVRLMRAAECYGSRGSTPQFTIVSHNFEHEICMSPWLNYPKFPISRTYRGFRFHSECRRKDRDVVCLYERMACNKVAVGAKIDADKEHLGCPGN